LAGDQVKMRGKALIDIALEHPIGKHILPSKVKVFMRFVLWHVRVLRILCYVERRLGANRGYAAKVPPVHPAVIVGCDEVAKAIAQIVANGQGHGL
jgi:hypothetical protein